MCTDTPNLLSPDDFALSMADPTRLRILVLLTQVEELCVCQLTETIGVLQPKMSRHLAILRKKGGLMDRREGLWIFHRLHPDMPAWTYNSLRALASGCLNLQPYKTDLAKIADTCLPEGYRIKMLNEE